MTGGNVETFYEDRMWKARREGRSQSLVVSTNRFDALNAGRIAAVRDCADHVIRGMDGRFLYRNSYRDLPGNLLGDHGVFPWACSRSARQFADWFRT